MLKKITVIFLLASLICAALPISVLGNETKIKVIIDAGHGGSDPGAIGVSGVYEKDLNLICAKMLRDMLLICGFEVIMTRTDDTLVLKDGEDKKGIRKTRDLKNRVEIAKDNPDAIFISIHMNSYQKEKYCGTQIYFSDNVQSRALAESMQNEVVSRLQTKNKRQIKEAGNNIYVLDNNQGVAVLIEYGFLSNYAECEKLSNQDYRRALSFCILCGIINYIDSV